MNIRDTEFDSLPENKCTFHNERDIMQSPMSHTPASSRITTSCKLSIYLASHIQDKKHTDSRPTTTNNTDPFIMWNFYGR